MHFPALPYFFSERNDKLEGKTKGQTYKINLFVFLHSHKLCISSRIMAWYVNGDVDQAAFGSSKEPGTGAKDLHSGPGCSSN